MAADSAPAVNRPMSGLELSLLATLSVLWGGTFLFQAVAIRELPPLTVVLGRVGLAAVALLALLRLTGAPRPAGRVVWANIAGMAILNNVIPFTLFAFAQTRIGIGLAAILNATTPLFAVLVTHLLTEDEKATPPRIAGALIGFGGVAVMLGQGAPGGVAGPELLAELACLGGALSYAFSGIQGRRLRGFGLPPATAAAGQVTASTLLLLPAVLLLDRPWLLPTPSPAALGCVLALALLSTALAYVIFFRILATAGATNLLLVTFLIPVSAILLGVVVLGEPLDGRQLAGMALIATGLAAIDGRPLAALRAALGRVSVG